MTRPQLWLLLLDSPRSVGEKDHSRGSIESGAESKLSVYTVSKSTSQLKPRQRQAEQNPRVSLPRFPMLMVIELQKHTKTTQLKFRASRWRSGPPRTPSSPGDTRSSAARRQVILAADRTQPQRNPNITRAPVAHAPPGFRTLSGKFSVGKNDHGQRKVFPLPPKRR